MLSSWHCLTAFSWGVETFPAPFDPCFVHGVQGEGKQRQERKKGIAAGVDANLQEHSIFFPSSSRSSIGRSGHRHLRCSAAVGRPRIVGFLEGGGGAANEFGRGSFLRAGARRTAAEGGRRDREDEEIKEEMKIMRGNKKGRGGCNQLPRGQES